MYKVLHIKEDKKVDSFLAELKKLVLKYKKIAKEHTTFSDKEYEEGDMLDLV